MSVKKAKIPDPKHADGNVEKFLDHGAHVGKQVAAGHYVPAGGSTKADPDGTVTSTIILKPTDPTNKPGPAPE